MNKNILLALFMIGIFGILLFAQSSKVDAKSSLLMMLTPTIGAGSGEIVAKKTPSLVLMAAENIDKIEMAWLPGGDGETPIRQIKYELHLSTDENFTPDSTTLIKTVKGDINQANITGLESDMIYYGKIRAVYHSYSEVTNELQTQTFKKTVQLDPSATVSVAAKLGLGKHTTADGITYTYAGGTLPPVGSILFSEDEAGGMTLRKVDSASSAGGAVTVQTSDASLTEVVDRGAISDSFQFVDIAGQANNLPANVRNSNIAAVRNFASADGSQHSRIKWKNRLLTAEQTNYASSDKYSSITPKGQASIIQLKAANAVDQSFTATVTANFQPQLITTAQWGGLIPKKLDSAHVAAKGTLSLTALAEYNFSAAASVNRNFQLWKRTWTSVYSVGLIPVEQEITLSLDVEASASASAEIKAMAKAKLAEIVEVGAKYDGSAWIPYITHNESESLTASLDIAGSATGEIRLIPKIEVKFYKVASASLTVEPSAQSSLAAEKTTSNLNFLTAHPERLVQLTSFNASLELECNAAVNLKILDFSWDVLPSTCVLGTGSCKYSFSPITLFSLPELTLSADACSGFTQNLSLQINDGVRNPFDTDSVRWEIFPTDGGSRITPGSCTKSGETTTCTATASCASPFSEDGKYTIFASGHGVLGELSRNFKETTLGKFVPPPQTESGTVLSPKTGRIWMDRNLGASRVATSVADTEAYGDLYQWGRGTDGHEKRTSGTTSTISSTDFPGHGDFITSNLRYGWWMESQRTDLWQGVDGINNPCPSGFRLPTIAEWQEEVNTWSSQDIAGAFASPLKLVPVGSRNEKTGAVAVSSGSYWSSTQANSNGEVFHLALIQYNNMKIQSGHSFPSLGRSVRCIKDAPPAPSQNIVTLFSPAGRIWMDRNLGASRVATSPTDEAGYGDLYQFGRGADGHEKRTSGTTSTISSMIVPNHGDFILEIKKATPGNPDVCQYYDFNISYGQLTRYGCEWIGICHGWDDWICPSELSGRWTGVNGVNNPCPAGFRLPTKGEFEAEIALGYSWYFSNMKFTMAGRRSDYLDINNSSIVKNISGVGTIGCYWIDGSNGGHPICLQVTSHIQNESGDYYTYTGVFANTIPFSMGCSVRCIKDKDWNSTVTTP